MDTKFAPFIKPGGQIALAFPGFKKDIHKNLPSEFFLSWKAEDLETFHSFYWWENLLSKSNKIHLDKIEEMSCLEECWHDWVKTDNPYAINDRKAINVGAGEYMNLISVLAKRIM